MENKILKAIEGLSEDFNSRFDALTSQVNTIASQVGTLTSQVGTLTSKVDTITSQVGTLTSQVGTLTGKVDTITSQLSTVSSQVDENTQILKALEHLAQVNKAEHDKMMIDIAETKGEVIAIRKELSAIELITANNWSDIVKLKAIK